MLAFTPIVSLAAPLPCLLPQKEGDHSLREWWRIYHSSTKGTFSSTAHPRIRRYKKSRWRKPSAFLVSSSPVLNAACPRRLCQPPWTQPSCKEPRPTLRRNQLRRSNQLQRQPLFGREGSGGRGASLREAASPPSVPQNVLSSGGSAREGLLEKKPPPSHLSILFRRFCFVCRGVFGGGSFAD